MLQNADISWVKAHACSYGYQLHLHVVGHVRDDLVSGWLGRQLRGRSALLALPQYGVHLSKDFSGIALR